MTNLDYRVPHTLVFYSTTLPLIISTHSVAVPANYTNEERHRYIAFLSSNRERPRNTHLSCDIRPDKLQQFYRVKWVAISESGAVSNLSNDGNYVHSVDIEIFDNYRYRCVVYIQHRSDRNETIAYDGRTITINKKG